MRFACSPVDESFFETAPWRFRNSVELEWSPARAFAALEDGASWPKWFAGMRKVEWTTPKPFGVGTTRTVTLTSMTADERFFRWEDGRRFSFYFTGASVPLFRALGEDYLLEPIKGGRTRFTYTVGVLPGVLLQLTEHIAKKQFEQMFAKASAGFVEFCSAQ